MHRRFFPALLALIMSFALALPTAQADSAAGLIAKALESAQAQADAASTAKATVAPTAKATVAPTAKATVAPTAKATVAPTAKATVAPTAKATVAPTAKATVAPTAKATVAPTAVPTLEPTAIPTVEPTVTPEPLPLPVRQDDQGELVKLIQTRLRTLGFLNDSADGYFGPMTRAGVVAFQEFVSEYMNIQLKYVDPDATPEPTAEPTEAPTAAPTEAPTAVPTLAASAAPGADATAQPTAEPTAVPTPIPTPEPTPYVADGIVDEAGYELLTGDGFTLYYSDLSRGSKGSDVKRLQTRLSNLYYLANGIDGIFGGNTESALKYFQKYNDLEQTGVADEATQLKLYDEDAVPTAKPTLAPANKNSKGNGKSYSKYKLVVDVSDQRVYAYGYENGAYGTLARVMICSTGTKSNPTPLGTFKGSGPSHRWHYFEKFECYAQYSWRIKGSILFHSVLYNEIDGSPTSSSVRNLGRRASHGCIRLSVEDAKWIYNNFASGTTVVVRE